MSDIRKSGDAVTLLSTGHFLKLVFMFISGIIMNIFMFNYCLNINTCTWFVSLTTILKYLFNYGIQIYRNIAYHLTQTAAPLGSPKFNEQSLQRVKTYLDLFLLSNIELLAMGQELAMINTINAWLTFSRSALAYDDTVSV
jgi:hypothetical protein